jgi:LPS-assembly lipoprotein
MPVPEVAGRRVTPRRMIPRRALLAGAVAGSVLPVLAGCGWEPLYADREAGPADAELRAIRIAPIPERIGQRLALALRQSFNPGGEPVPQRYVLNTTLNVVRVDLGIQTQGFGTLGRVDVYATIGLFDIKTGTQLLSGVSHAAESFTIMANEYSDVVAEENARNQAAEQVRSDIVNRLTLYMQRRVATTAAKP